MKLERENGMLRVSYEGLNGQSWGNIHSTQRRDELFPSCVFPNYLSYAEMKQINSRQSFIKSHAEEFINFPSLGGKGAGFVKSGF